MSPKNQLENQSENYEKIKSTLEQVVLDASLRDSITLHKAQLLANSGYLIELQDVVAGIYNEFGEMVVEKFIYEVCIAPVNSKNLLYNKLQELCGEKYKNYDFLTIVCIFFGVRENLFAK